MIECPNCGKKSKYVEVWDGVCSHADRVLTKEEWQEIYYLQNNIKKGVEE
jgi:sarcosine oxidase delta subunit